MKYSTTQSRWSKCIMIGSQFPRFFSTPQTSASIKPAYLKLSNKQSRNALTYSQISFTTTPY